MSQFTISPETKAAKLKFAAGEHTTVAAADTVATGLKEVLACGVSADDDPVDDAMNYTASRGDQAGTPAAGSILIKGWKFTDADSSHIAASVFGKKVGWWAIGY